MNLLETPRLQFRRLEPADAPFIARLVNDPDWLRYIGDRNVHSDADAVRYIRNGPMASYARFGYGLWRVALRSGDIPIGICGLLKRDTLPHPDIGFAYLPDHRGQGYGVEAAQATLRFGRTQFGLRTILAITSPDNDRSMALLRKAGMRFEGTIRLSPDQAESRLFSISL